MQQTGVSLFCVLRCDLNLGRLGWCFLGVLIRLASVCPSLRSQAIVMKLLEYNADASVPRATDGATPLYVAVEKSYKGVVRVLLSNSGYKDVNAPTWSGQAPLWTACRRNHRDSASALINAKADINGCDKRGRTALHQAARGNHLDCVKLLVRRKAILDATTAKPTEVTPLMSAADRGAAEAVGELLRLKADTDKRDGNGRTALHHGMLGGHTDVVRVMEDWYRQMHPADEAEEEGTERRVPVRQVKRKKKKVKSTKKAERPEPHDDPQTMRPITMTSPRSSSTSPRDTVRLTRLNLTLQPTERIPARGKGGISPVRQATAVASPANGRTTPDFSPSSPGSFGQRPRTSQGRISRSQ